MKSPRETNDGDERGGLWILVGQLLMGVGLILPLAAPTLTVGGHGPLSPFLTWVVSSVACACGAAIYFSEAQLAWRAWKDDPDRDRCVRVPNDGVVRRGVLVRTFGALLIAIGMTLPFLEPPLMTGSILRGHDFLGSVLLLVSSCVACTVGGVLCSRGGNAK